VDNYGLGLGKGNYSKRKEFAPWYDRVHDWLLTMLLEELKSRNIACGRATLTQDKKEHWDLWINDEVEKWDIKVSGRDYNKNDDEEEIREQSSLQSTERFCNSNKIFFILDRPHEDIEGESDLAVWLINCCVEKIIKEEYYQNIEYEHKGSYTERQQGVEGKGRHILAKAYIVRLKDGEDR